MKDTFRYTLIPVILGANFRARLWADRIRYRFGVRTHIMSEKYHPALLFAPSLRYHKLSQSNGYSDFVLAELIDFANDHPDKLLVLIATSAYYSALIHENQAELEKYYILSDPELSFLVREKPNDTCRMKGERA